MENLCCMFLFYSTKSIDSNIYLTGDEHLHCTKVLRKQLNDQIFITDGEGHIYTATIISANKTETCCKIEQTETIPKPLSELAVAISPTKNLARLEWFVEKAVEIGISNIFIFQAHRTEKKIFNTARLEKIMISAMKQSLNVHLPELKYFPHLSDLFQYVGQFNFKFIAHCEGPTALLHQQTGLNGKSIVMIGPEGDFTEQEIKLASDNDFHSVSLGKSRLRTETAGLVALMMMKYL